MAVITLGDGRNNTLLDTLTMRTSIVTLEQHAMRFHELDPKSNTAVKHYVPKTTAERNKIINYVVNRDGGNVWFNSGWIHVKNQAIELRDALNYRRMVENDLRAWWGDAIEVTGTAIRSIYYFSDGGMSSTPSAIGTYNRKPLVYKGRAIATIFKIGGKDVLDEDSCVVYWLPKPWWKGFHDSYRGVHRDFPKPCGFVCSNWCQRFGNARYSGGKIWIADMSQGQTIGTWSTGNLVNFWKGRGVDLMRYAKSEYINIRSTTTSKKNARKRMALIIAARNTDYGRIGTVCMECGEWLAGPYSGCIVCGAKNYTYMYIKSRVWCARCGRSHKKCKCEIPSHITIEREHGHERHFGELTVVRDKVLASAYKQDAEYDI